MGTSNCSACGFAISLYLNVNNEYVVRKVSNIPAVNLHQNFAFTLAPCSVDSLF